jgi:hypothetical protein
MIELEEYVDENGLHHRIDGPAVIYDNGDESWYVHGVRHRSDGPALTWHGNTGWFIEGYRHYTYETFQIAGGLSDEHIMVLRLKYGEI